MGARKKAGLDPKRISEADAGKMIQDIMDAQDELNILLQQLHKLYLLIRSQGVKLGFDEEDLGKPMTEAELRKLDDACRREGDLKRQLADAQEELDARRDYQDFLKKTLIENGGGIVPSNAPPSCEGMGG